MGRTAMADWYENDRMWTMQNGADVAGAVNTGVGVSVLDGATTVIVDGFTAALAVGSSFTFAATYDVHPETKAAYSHLKQFVVTAATTTLITFSPALYASTTDAKQNCSGRPTDNDVITAVGAASTNYVQNLMYHKEAYQFITAPLPILDDAQKCVRAMKDNLSLRAWMASDIRNNELLMRIDILYGMASLKPEWGVRMIGAAG